MAQYQILTDLDKCIGCESCTAACMQENNLDSGIFYVKVSQQGPYGDFPNIESYYLPTKCQHCDNPPCVHVCPTTASYKREEDGIVLVDHSKCIGCQYCVMACPYGVRTMNPKEHVIEKCTLCPQRIDKSEKPACVEICPAHARIFGDVEDKNSEISQYIEAHKDHVHKFADVGNKPGDLFVLSSASWKE